MPTLPLTVFDVPHAAKSEPRLIADDDAHLARVAARLEQQVAELTDRLAEARRAPGGSGTAALERDQEVHRLSARLRTLRRYGLDLCLGRTLAADGQAVYVGRVGLTDADDTRLLVDWRSPTAEPFFAATPARPMGAVARRRYRWTRGRVTDYWDEVLVPDAVPAGRVAPDDDSALLASLGASRSARMRDVLTTIQADQDAIVRAGSAGPLVVDGGPGTGKTVVALHRAAYLLYADPRLGHRRGGLLFVGPHEPYLDYVSDVLPSLGEDGVRTCTLRDLVPEGAAAVPEADPRVARLKGSRALVEAVEPAVRFSERPPTTSLLVETPWADVPVTPADWAGAFAAPEDGTPHNEARDDVLAELVEILAAKVDDVPVDRVRAALAADADLLHALNRAWPLIEPTDLVADLWSVPAYLRLCAPSLTPDEVALLQRTDPTAWTVADLPLLDAARARLGDATASRRRRAAAAREAADRATMAEVVDHLVASDDSELQVMTMLRVDDLRDALVDRAPLPQAPVDAFAGPFAHVVVDEAQELTDAEWLMLARRCPSRSMTVVGDRAQARRGFAEPWQERLERVGLGGARLATLGVNYRTPAEVMAAAEPVIRAVLPDANVPTSIRSTRRPVEHGSVDELTAVLTGWLRRHEGVACVIGAPAPALPGTLRGVLADRVRALTPRTAKGLEFDLVVLVDPGAWGDGDDEVATAVDRYVAMTRATHTLVVLTPASAPAGGRSR